MTNIEKIRAFLEKEGAHCDACILQKTPVSPHQQVNRICREKLEARKVVHREKTRCAGCGRHITVNHLIGLHRAAPATPPPPVTPPMPAAVEESLNVRISSNAHRTVWGKRVSKITDIPCHDARRAFECIARADGFQQIVLHEFGRGDQRNEVGVKCFESNENFIEGRIFDLHAKNGTWQNFRVHVQYPDRIPAIRESIANELCARGLWAGKPAAQ